MRFRHYLFFILSVAIAAWSLIPTASGSSQPALQPAAVAMPAFAMSTAHIALPVALAPPPASLLGLPSSVMPPGPAPGTVCSTSSAPNVCSALVPGEHCSAFNDNGNLCSTFQGSNACSVTATGRACSVLPPSFGANPSQCTTFTDTLTQCSALTTAPNLRCTTKGAGLSQCSVFNGPAGGGGGLCSVFNVGGTSNSFCSTKFNQPTIAKGCSTFVSTGECSIFAGGKGRCTAFGSALAPSCSAFAPGSHCSVIAGAPGSFCTQ